MNRKLREKTIHTENDPDFIVDANYILYQNQGETVVKIGDWEIQPGQSWADGTKNDNKVFVVENQAVEFVGDGIKKFLVKEYIIS